jgi:hypothetical protein
MFERISIQKQRIGDAESYWNLGFLAEAMLFYGRVNIIANRSNVAQLIRAFGPDVLIEFLDRQHLVLYVEPNMPGIVTENTGTRAEWYFPSVIKVQRDSIEYVQPTIMDMVGKSGRARRLSLRLLKKVDATPVDDGLAERVKADIADPRYLVEGARRIIASYLPDWPGLRDLRFEVVNVHEGKFHIHTNINFLELNSLYHRVIPPSHSTMSVAYILSHMLSARKFAEDAAATGSEIAVAPVYRDLITLRIERALEFRRHGARQIEIFQDFVFDRAHAVGDAIERGQRTFKDLLPVLERAGKFRKWLHERSADADLLKEYYRATTEQSWIEKEPATIARWVMFTGAGVIADLFGAAHGLGAVGGVALSAMNDFLIDKLAKGWRPNQFVEGPMRKFSDRLRVG